MTSGKFTTIARPYTQAAFEFAAQKKDIAAWENMLDAAACMSENKSVQEMLTDPEYSPQKLYHFYCEILSGDLDEAKRNFLHLLAENHRLQILPDIAALFKEARAESEKIISVEVTSSARLSDGYQQKLITALTKRLQKKVELECKTDPTILGGIIVRAGDLVIDGSVRGKLTRLLDSL